MRRSPSSPGSSSSLIDQEPWLGLHDPSARRSCGQALPHFELSGRRQPHLLVTLALMPSPSFVVALAFREVALFPPASSRGRGRTTTPFRVRGTDPALAGSQSGRAPRGSSQRRRPARGTRLACTPA